MKRILSALLVLVMVFSFVPVSALAEEETPTVDTDMSVEGTTSVGELVANSLDGYSEQTAEACHITDIEMTGTSAAVSFETDRASDVVVAVYTEDGAQMLGSGKSTVTAEETSAVITVEIEEMPEYFVVGAYLLDTETHEPLCDCFLNRLYTKEMQELLNSDINDYDPERVVNLDDDETTNFVVFGDGVLLTEETAGVNEVTDNGDGTYTIKNADADYKALKAGDTFSYTYADGTMLIVVVKSAKVSGNTVTVTEDTEAELEDVFDYVKIEGDSNPDQPLSIDMSSADEGIALIENEPAMDGAIEKEVSMSNSLSFSISPTLYEHEEYKLDMTGTFSIKLKTTLKIYISYSYQFVELKIGIETGISAEIKAKISAAVLKLGEITIPFSVPGIYAQLEPALVIEASAAMTASYTTKATIDWIYDSDYGLRDASKKPESDSNFEVEGKLFVGLKFTGRFVVVTEAMLSTDLSATIGMEASLSKNPFETSEATIHTCSQCYAGSINRVYKLEVGIKMLDEYINLRATLASITSKWRDIYLSVYPLYKEFGFGTCPHISYKVEVTVSDADNTPVEGAIITAKDTNGDPIDLKDKYNLSCEPITDETGKAVFYITNGEYTLYAETDELSAEQTFTVHNGTKKVKAELKKLIVASGQCGDSIYWTLDGKGTLVINGSGNMWDYGSLSSITPWKSSNGEVLKYDIIRVIIGENISSIGNCMFIGCTYMENIQIAHTVKRIGEYAFRGCRELSKLEIPANVEQIGKYAFEGCASIESINIPDHIESIDFSMFDGCEKLSGVIVSANNSYYSDINGVLFSKDKKKLLYCPEGITGEYNVPTGTIEICEDSFNNCDKLISITLPSSIEKVDIGAFLYCNSLSNIIVSESNLLYSDLDGVLFDKTAETLILYPYGRVGDYSIPYGVSVVGDYAFDIGNSASCPITRALKNVTIPTSVTSIGAFAFRNCTELNSIVIPDSVTSIGDYAFGGCTALSSVQLPSKLTTIGNSAFRDCSSLSFISIPDSVTYIGAGAFCSCTNLQTIILPSNITTIEFITFDYCLCLASVTIPVSVSNIGSSAFEHCGNLTDVYYLGNEEQWEKINIKVYGNGSLLAATIHCLNEIIGADGEPAEEETLPIMEETPVPLEEIPSEEEITSEEPVEEVPSEEKPAEEEISTYEDDDTSVLALTPVIDESDIIAESAAKYTGSVTAEGVRSVARFTGLVPGAAYVMLAVADTEAADLLDPSNLLFIIQGTAGDSGSLNFSYIPRLDEVGGVVLYGESTKNLKDALVTATKKGGDYTIMVSYEGEMLMEERDFTVDYETNDSGIATVTVTGRDDYAGTKTVALATIGDVNGDSRVDALDLVRFAYYLSGDSKDIVTGALNINGDDNVDLLDLVCLMKYIAVGL